MPVNDVDPTPDRTRSPAPGSSLPAELLDIRDEAMRFAEHGDERARTSSSWAHQSERIRLACPGVTVEDGGDTIRLGHLSPGCRACKAGQWDCLFLSQSCNLSCPFCLTPNSLPGEFALSALGNDLDAVVEAYRVHPISGVSFSGGEPLIVPDRLFHLLSGLHAKRPDLYFWAYTNGLALSADLVSALADAGLQELRFNMAATGYSHSHVTAMLSYAATCLPAVTVEIPAIPEDEGLLQEALPVWDRLGVKYVNLHELIYEPESPSATMPGAREECRMPDGHRCEFNPHSSELVADVLRHVASADLELAVNYCSLRNKARQLRGRRHLMADHTMHPFERLCGDDSAESVCYFTDTICGFAHPESLVDPAGGTPGSGAALVRRLLPLSPGGPDQWIRFELVREAVTKA